MRIWIPLEDLRELIASAIVDEPPLSVPGREI